MKLGRACPTLARTVASRRAPFRLELLQTNSGPQVLEGPVVIVRVVVNVNRPEGFPTKPLKANLQPFRGEVGPVLHRRVSIILRGGASGIISATLMLKFSMAPKVLPSRLRQWLAMTP